VTGIREVALGTIDAPELRQFVQHYGVIAITGCVDVTVGTAKRNRSKMEDDMRKIITGAVIVAVAAITTAWTVSNPGITSKAGLAINGVGAVPARAPLLW
jgi:hypothetical protein